MDMCGGLKALLEEKEVEGFKLRLIKQTEKKIKKGYSAEEIAEMLEEEVSVIVEIMKELEEK